MATEAPMVDAVDSKKRTSAINSSQPGDKFAQGQVCYWNGTAYSVGATVCSDGSLLKCQPDGSWSAVGTC
jgi:hypothetical protein